MTPIKDISSVSRSRYDPGSDELSITLPHHARLALHGSRNGSFQIRRLSDGGVEVSCRQNIHAWGSTETIRLDSDAWAVVQAFAAGAPGSSYISPYRDTALTQEIRKEMDER